MLQINNLNGKNGFENKFETLKARNAFNSESNILTVKIYTFIDKPNQNKSYEKSCGG